MGWVLPVCVYVGRKGSREGQQGCTASHLVVMAQQRETAVCKTSKVGDFTRCNAKPHSVGCSAYGWAVGATKVPAEF